MDNIVNMDDIQTKVKAVMGKNTVTDLVILAEVLMYHMRNVKGPDDTQEIAAFLNKYPKFKSMVSLDGAKPVQTLSEAEMTELLKAMQAASRLTRARIEREDVENMPQHIKDVMSEEGVEDVWIAAMVYAHFVNENDKESAMKWLNKYKNRLTEKKYHVSFNESALRMNNTRVG